MRPLHDLLRQFRPVVPAIPNLPITGIQEDSRLIQPGNLFIARTGTQTNGNKFIQDAKSRGAVAVITTTESPDCPLPQITFPDPGVAASELAHAFFNHPSESFKVLGVTGTNGKTTTTYLLRHVLNKLNKRCGMIGTVEIDDGKSCHESTMTTPGAIQLAELMATMRDNSCQAAALEISSHSLHQRRAAGVHFAGAAFTNLTGDHLDYHQTMENYAAAKAMLFEQLPTHAIAAVNADDPWTPRISRNCPARIIRFGFNESAHYRAADSAITAQGTHFILHTPDGHAEIALQLIGKHNIENTLAAAALLGEVFGFSVHQLATGLKDAAGAPGRLQAVRAGQPFAVLVDYAHTDDALENVLTALRPPHPQQTNRPLRHVAWRPRSHQTPQNGRYCPAPRRRPLHHQRQSKDRESSKDFRRDLRRPFCRKKQVGNRTNRPPPRHRTSACNKPPPGDVILIAGKGHENYQIIGTTKHHFDDVEECQRVLAGRSVAA